MSRETDWTTEIFTKLFKMWTDTWGKYEGFLSNVDKTQRSNSKWNRVSCRLRDFSCYRNFCRLPIHKLWYFINLFFVWTWQGICLNANCKNKCWAVKNPFWELFNLLSLDPLVHIHDPGVHIHVPGVHMLLSVQQIHTHLHSVHLITTMWNEWNKERLNCDIHSMEEEP